MKFCVWLFLVILVKRCLLPCIYCKLYGNKLTITIYREIHCLIKDNIITLDDPAKMVVNGGLTQFLRKQTQTILKAAIEAEVNKFISAHSEN